MSNDQRSTQESSRREFLRTITCAAAAATAFNATGIDAMEPQLVAGSNATPAQMPPIPPRTFNTSFEDFQDRFIHPGIVQNPDGSRAYGDQQALMRDALGVATFTMRAIPQGFLSSNRGENDYRLALAMTEHATLSALVEVIAGAVSDPSRPMPVWNPIGNNIQVAQQTYLRSLNQMNLSFAPLRNVRIFDAQLVPTREWLGRRAHELRIALRGLSALAYLRAAGGVTPVDAATEAQKIREAINSAAARRPDSSDGVPVGVPLSLTAEAAQQLLDQAVAREQRALELRPGLAKDANALGSSLSPEGQIRYGTGGPPAGRPRQPPPMPPGARGR